jgi:hypothetical protein
MNSTPIESQHPVVVLPYPEDPEYWLNDYLEGNLVRQSFYAKLMDCVVSMKDVPAVLRCLPANRLKDFTETMEWVAAKKREEDFVVIGDTVRWGVQDARQMVQWLAEHPHPQLAPPDRKLEPDPSWEPPETEYEYRLKSKRLADNKGK